MDPMPYLCRVENLEHLVDQRSFTLVGLAQDLNFAQLAEIEVALLLEAIDGQLQLCHLRCQGIPGNIVGAYTWSKEKVGSNSTSYETSEIAG